MIKSLIFFLVSMVKNQAWILALDIEKCPTKIQVVSDKGYFITDTVV